MNNAAAATLGNALPLGGTHVIKKKIVSSNFFIRRRNTGALHALSVSVERKCLYSQWFSNIATALLIV